MTKQIILATRSTLKTELLIEKHIRHDPDYNVTSVNSVNLNNRSFSLREQSCLLVDGSRYSVSEFIKIINQAQLLYSTQCQILCALFNVSKRTENQLIHQYQGWYLFRGTFPVNCSGSLVLNGLNKIFAGDYWLPRSFMKTYLEMNNPLQNRYPILNEDTYRTLSPKEIEVLTAICNGMSNAEVADDMFISQCTVKTHVYNIFRKLHVKNRLQAANRYIEYINSTHTHDTRH